MGNGLVEIKEFRGLNVLDSEYSIANGNYAAAALNVDFKRGAVETTHGFDLLNADSSKTGGIKYILPYYNAAGTVEQLIFFHDDDVYSLDLSAAIAESTAWGAVGDYGTASDTPRAIVYDDWVIIGGGGANTLNKWDGTNYTAVTNQPAATNGVNVFEILEGRDFKSLFGVKEGTNTAYWCVPGDPDDWTGANSGSLVIGKNDGDGIYSLVCQGGLMWTIKKRRKYSVDIIYDQVSSSYIPDQNMKTDRSGGTVASDSVKVISSKNVAGDIRMLSRLDGVSSFGQPSGFNDAYVSQTMSELINPLIYKQINWKYAHLANAIYWDRKYRLSVPFAASQSNSGLIVEHLDTEDFSIHNHINARCFTIARNYLDEEDLYFGDSFEPKIYKENKNRYDVDGNGYLRKYRTGKITFGGASTLKDNLKWIDIEGAIKDITTLYVKVITDSFEKIYKITYSQILESTSGAYIGDNIVGSEIVGGLAPSSDKFRFIAHIDIGNLQRDFRSIQIEFYNSEVGEYWKVDRLVFDFLDQRSNLPRNSKYILTPIT